VRARLKKRFTSDWAQQRRVEHQNTCGGRCLGQSHRVSAHSRSVVIPPKRHRKDQRGYDRELYKARHLIENFFAKLKQFRAIATRYDKTDRNFLAAIQWAAAYIWLI
jgi:transposase